MKTLFRRRASRGQALVEFAIVAPVFFLLLFGLIDLGRYVYVTNSFAQAAREGTRFASVWRVTQPCAASVASKDIFTCTAQETRNRLAGAPAFFTVSVTCKSKNQVATLTAAQCTADAVLSVTIATPTTPTSQRFTFFTPFIGQLVSSPVISATSQVIVQ